jgi:hypothetical protein
MSASLALSLWRTGQLTAPADQTWQAGPVPLGAASTYWRPAAASRRPAATCSCLAHSCCCYVLLSGSQVLQSSCHVLLPSCHALLLSSCQPLLLSSCKPLLLSSCQPLLLSSCKPLLLSSCQPLLLSSCKTLLLSSCQPLLLHSCHPLLLSSCHLKLFCYYALLFSYYLFLPRSSTSLDIDLNIGDIRHPTSTSVIPISKENMSDWKLSFWYWKGPILEGSDIGMVRYRKGPISEGSDIGRVRYRKGPISEGSDIGRVRYRHLSPFRYLISKKYLSHQQDLNSRHLFSQPVCWFMNFWMSDIRYQIKVYFDIRYNVGLHSLQSKIRSSDIKLSPISLITDIGVSTHLWPWHRGNRHVKDVKKLKALC